MLTKLKIVVILKPLNNYYLEEVEKTHFYQQACPGESSLALHVFCLRQICMRNSIEG